MFAVALATALSAAACDIKVDDGRLSLGVSRGRASDEWTRTYPISKGGRLEILNQNGSITAEGTTGSQVEIKAVREATGSSDEAARARLEGLKMREEIMPDHIVVEVERAGGSIGFGDRGLTIRYEVKVPAGLNVRLRTANGAVRLEHLDGRIVASTTNGQVAGTAAGAVEASTVNGGVQLELSAVRGDVRMTAVNGGIRLTVPADVSADLEARTVNGRVSIDDALRLEGSSGGERGTSLSGRIGKGGPRLSLQTTNGGVRIGVRGGPVNQGG